MVLASRTACVRQRRVKEGQCLYEHLGRDAAQSREDMTCTAVVLWRTGTHCESKQVCSSNKTMSPSTLTLFQRACLVCHKITL